jgi:hypothetical protein
MPTTPQRYTYHDGLATLSKWSDRRVRTSAKITEWIEATAKGSRVSLLDIGTGDGELLAMALAPLLSRVDLQMIELVEPDIRLRGSAVDRLRNLGISAASIRVSNGLEDTVGRRYSHALAAHVLYYLLPAEESLASIGRLLGEDGNLCLVIRSEACDTYLMRQIVRAHEGTQARLSAQSVTESLGMIGFSEVAVSSVGATLQCPEDVSVLAEGSDTITSSESFDYIIRWMTRLTEFGPIDAPVRESLRTFVSQRVAKNGLTLNLEDRVITASRESVANPVED